MCRPDASGLDTYVGQCEQVQEVWNNIEGMQTQGAGGACRGASMGQGFADA